MINQQKIKITNFQIQQAELQIQLIGGILYIGAN